MLKKILNNGKTRNISTKDLYLASLKYCYKKDQRYSYFKLLDSYVLVRKKDSNYEDIFTHTLYDGFPITQVGKVYIDSAFPIISSLGYISSNEAKEILAKKNFVFLDENLQDENNIEITETPIGLEIEPVEDSKKLIKK